MGRRRAGSRTIETGKIKGQLKGAAVEGVKWAWRRSIKVDSAQYLDVDKSTKTAQKLAPMSELVNLVGNIDNGKTEADLTFKFQGGTSQSYKMNQVVSMKKMS